MPINRDWTTSEEGQVILSRLLRPGPVTRRRVYGVLSEPSLSLPLVTWKVFVTGKAGCGKTSVVATLAGSEVPKLYDETLGMQMSTVYWPIHLTAEDQVALMRCHFWDAGDRALARFDHVRDACTAHVSVVVFVFSLTDLSSWNELPGRMDTAAVTMPSARAVVVGTSLDNEAARVVTPAAVLAFERARSVRVRLLSATTAATSAKGVATHFQFVGPILNDIADEALASGGTSSADSEA